MVKHLINNFFPAFCYCDTNSFVSSIQKYVCDKDLITQLLLEKEFKTSWREKINYSLYDEKYNVKILSKTFSKNTAKLNVSVTHNFSLINTYDVHRSSEVLKFAIILKKIAHSWTIYDLCDNEFSKEIYNYILSSDISDYHPKYRQHIINFWKNKIDTIDDIVSCFSISSYKYRTNYFNSNSKLIYDYKKAVAYARKYALDYNKNYKSFADMGGDCTNFISQCLKAGNLKENILWKPYTYSWIRVNYLYNYLIDNTLAIDITNTKEFPPGSMLQFFNNEENAYAHSVLITQALPNGDYLYCCHSYDKLDYPLSEIYPLFYQKFRVLEIIV